MVILFSFIYLATVVSNWFIIRLLLLNGEELYLLIVLLFSVLPAFNVIFLIMNVVDLVGEEELTEMIFRIKK